MHDLFIVLAFIAIVIASPLAALGVVRDDKRY